MFAPEGFTPLAPIAWAISTHASYFIREGDFPDADPADYERFRVGGTLGTLFTKWLWDHAFFQQPFPIFASSLDGRLVRVSQLFFFTGEQPSWGPFSWPLEEWSPLREILYSDEPAQNIADYYGYPLVDEVSWTIRTPQPECHSKMTKGYEVATSSMADVASQLHGWALCMRDEHVEQLYAHLSSLFTWRQNQTFEKTSGRPEHPAKAWYASQGYKRKGRAIKELQRQMAEKTGVKPPSPSAIYEWEKLAEVLPISPEITVENTQSDI